MEFTITPKVDETQEFIEIANDFANPLDLVREAISNASDAGAKQISIEFRVEKIAGESVLIIELIDDGSGMDRDGLQTFFDLGNSLRREDSSTIGEKGHGTKVYFNSKKVVVETWRESRGLQATMNEPIRKLHDREIPLVEVRDFEPQTPAGTKVTIYGYNNNRRTKFNHERIRDHVKWFTPGGSIQHVFDDNAGELVVLLKGLGREGFEKLAGGHLFGEPSGSMQKLFDEHVTSAPHFYCRRVVKTGQLKDHPEIAYQAVFAIEGKRVKYECNPMLRRQGYSPPEGAYKVQDRYGLWLCKDFVPIQRKNDWVPTRGSEWTRLHAFINCQDFRLTANRGSIENTPSEIMDDLRKVANEIYEDIVDSDDWRDLEWLEDEAAAHRTVEKEKKDFAWRIKRVNNANIANYKGTTLVEPTRESGVFSLFLQLLAIEPGAFPFTIVDYDTHEGIDVIAKGDETTPISKSKLFYVEFKHTLDRKFNHSFENLHSIICWDTQLKHDSTIDCLGGSGQRTMKIVPPEHEGEHTRYLLDNVRASMKIEVFVLKDYLKEKLKIEFRPRTEDSVV